MAAPMDKPRYPVVAEAWSEKVCRMVVLGSGNQDFLMWRYCGAGVSEITDIQVGSERGVGKGRALVDGLLDLLRQAATPDKTVSKVFAVTRMSNMIARQFYRAIGFAELGTLWNFYPETGAKVHRDEGHAMVFGRDV